jgi:hypothetical protein
MKSTDLAKFSDWHKWSSDAVRKAPDRPGVYAFRLVGNGFGRFKGESDLVYIGCTESSHGTINRRLSDHLPSRADVLDVAHRLRDAQKVGELEVGWKIATTQQEAIDEEARLLRHCYWDHFELPPANRSEPISEVRKAIEYLTESTARELAEKAVEYLIREERLKKGPSLATTTET